MTTKSPDLCSFPHCRKIAEYTIEGKGLCEEHVGEVHDTKLKKFKEDQARTRGYCPSNPRHEGIRYSGWMVFCNKCGSVISDGGD